MSSRTSIQEALSISKNRADREAADDREFHLEARRRYCELIIRSDRPEPGDAKELANIMADLAINAESLQEDVAAVIRARELWVLHVDKDRRRIAMSGARDKIRDMRKRHEEELRQQFREQQERDNEYRNASEAAHELGLLRRSHSYLFDNSEPPKLIFAADGSSNAALEHFEDKPVRKPAKLEELIHGCPGAGREFLLEQIGRQATVEEAKQAFAKHMKPAKQPAVAMPSAETDRAAREHG